MHKSSFEVENVKQHSVRLPGFFPRLPMYRSLALILWIPLIVGACHRGGGHSKSDRGAVMDSSKSARRPQGLNPQAHGREAKSVRPPVHSEEVKPRVLPQRDVKQAKKPHGEERASSVQKPVAVVKTPPATAPRKGSGTNTVSGQEPEKKPAKISRDSALIGKAAGRVSRTLPKMPAPEANASDLSPAGVPAPMPEPPSESPAAVVSAGTGQVGSEPLPVGVSSKGEAVDTGSTAAVMKESTAPSPSEVGAKPSVENDSKAPSLKPEQPESEKVAEKTPAAEPGAEAPASLQPSKPAGAGKSAVGGGIGAPKAAAAGKLTQAERKKQTEVQKREETQRAAEQSYEAGLQFIRESRDADAIKAFRQTVKLAPDSADAWLRLAYLCEKEGKTEEAMRAFKEAKRLWSF